MHDWINVCYRRLRSAAGPLQRANMSWPRRSHRGEIKSSPGVLLRETICLSASIGITTNV
ncbi:hypothetical protein EYF80_023295 [Liparis tanakae]|uniref:Uncharacterized protein n=1 Tax=Liparis tanakae TaxID=230148 RepID=A0A4Z2HNZ3_9TELE|nr:hypothetical protein EYF80_023295 [Liparis tanakae]